MLLAWEMWRGWRAGVVRSAISLLAIILSALVGLAAGKLASLPFGGVGEMPGLIVGALVGGGLGLFVFFLVWFLGAVLFKRTEHQSSGIFRFFWGAGGAAIGLVIGLFIVWSSISIVRALGALGQARVETVAKQEKNQTTQHPPKIASGLATLKDSLELGPAGKFVQAVDPIPPDFYELIEQMGRLSGDQETMLRFIQYPGIQEIMQSPRMVELINDPEVIRAAEKRDILSLMANKSLLAAVQDPAMAEKLQKIDLRAAMKFALESPPPSPSPSPTAPVIKK